MEKAEKVLWKANDMQKICKSLVLDVVTYNSIVHGYLRDENEENGLQRILRIVEYMDHHKDEQPSISPDAFTFHCLLRAWKNSRDPESSSHAVQALGR